MTKKLYDLDAYKTSFEATVLEVTPSEKGYLTILDQTLFFPEEGGQTPDKGVFGNAQVLDIQIKGDTITHLLDTELAVGNSYTGEIDWEHRFSNMQNHTGEHIFSGIVNKKYGYNNVGFHLSDSIVTMDYDGVLTKEQAAEIEREANEIIWKSIAVNPFFPTPEEAAALEYRSKIEITEGLRIVEIPDVDMCACCAPHVKSTAEVGIIKVLSVQNYKGGVRLSILCGRRAFLDYAGKAEITSALTNLYSSKEDEIVGCATKYLNETKELSSKIKDLESKALFEKLGNINPDDKLSIIYVDSLPGNVVREGVNKMMEASNNVCGIFSGNDIDGYSFVIGSKSIDVTPYAEAIRAEGGKCGGSSQMIQGKVQKKVSL